MPQLWMIPSAKFAALESCPPSPPADDTTEWKWNGILCWWVLVPSRFFLQNLETVSRGWLGFPKPDHRRMHCTAQQNRGVFFDSNVKWGACFILNQGTAKASQEKIRRLVGGLINLVNLKEVINHFAYTGGVKRQCGIIVCSFVRRIDSFK